MIMQAKFKVGDKIRCIDNSEYPRHLTLGKVYTVVESETDSRYVHIESDHDLAIGGYKVGRFELVEPSPVLTPEEVFEHLRKGTKLQWCCKSTLNWLDHSGELNRIKLNELIDYSWRVKPEPEVIELNGKRYKLIEE